MDDTQQSLNTAMTRCKLANQNEAVCPNESTSSVRKHTTALQSVRRKGKSRNWSKKHRFHAPLQLVAPSVKIQYSPVQFVDTTGDELEPARKLTQYDEL